MFFTASLTLEFLITDRKNKMSLTKRKNTGVNEFNQQMKGSSLWADAWKRLMKNKMSVIGLVITGLYILVAILAPVLPIYPYEQQVIDHAYLPPSFKPAGEILLKQKEAYFAKVMKKEKRTEYNAAELEEINKIKDEMELPVNQRHYILGTDSLGRDMLSRTIYGGRISISIGLIGTVTALIIGVLVGAIAGYAGGVTDSILMRIVDIMYGLPYMLMVIIMMAVLGRSVAILFIAIALVSWLTIARVVRAQIMSLKHSEYVDAARTMGGSGAHIVFRHLLPNTLGIIITYATLSLPEFIMSESFLSFLGLGVSAPLASWGSLVSDGVKGMELYPWILLVPAVVMTVFLFAMNFLGDGVRDAFDPQSKNRV